MGRSRHLPDFVKAALGALGFALVVAVAVAAFTWPAARLEPRSLSVGVAGTAPAAGALEQRLAEQSDAFDVRRYADEADARAAIKARQVYGAVVASPNGVTLLTASAASPAVAQILEEAFASRESVRVVDVVPADRDDPRGVAFSSLLLPLTLVGALTGVVLTRLTRPGLVQAGGLVGAALLVGATAIGIVQGWLGVLGGDWWVNAGVVALVVLAIASLVAGLTALFGPGGLVVAALLVVLVGNPLSGVSSAPGLLPEWAGVLGQLLPPGAGGTLLRSSAFFDGAGGDFPAIVLLAWTAFGFAAVVAGARRRRGTPARRQEPATRPDLRVGERMAARG
jgi:hypothetical protein